MIRKLLTVGVGAGTATLLAGSILASASYAAVGPCKTDPTVNLSNGVSVQLWDTIDTDIGNVSGVSYVLHVPKGVSITSIDYDSTGYLENVQVMADQSGTHYEDVTTATLTSGSNVVVTGYAIRRDSTTASKNGKTDSAITLNWCT